MICLLCYWILILYNSVLHEKEFVKAMRSYDEVHNSLRLGQKGNFARGFPREETLNQCSTKCCRINNCRTGNEEL